MHFEFPVNKLVLELQYDNLLPAILFRTSRKQCDLDIEKLSHTQSCQVSNQTQLQLKDAVDRIIAKYNFEPEVVTGHPHYQALIMTAAGAHHAGQLLVWRLLLEELMSMSMLRLMVATGTVAAGVDFPARTVIVTAHSKRSSDGFGIITSSEFMQMAGRAGRRGKDSVGICLIAPGPFSDARVLGDVAKRPPEPLRSSYFAAPSTVLNLLKFRNTDELKYTVSKSLASFLDRKSAAAIRQESDRLLIEAVDNPELRPDQKKKAEKRARRQLHEAEILERRQETALEASLVGLDKLGHIKEGKLTQKGSWAAELCTSLVLELAETIEEGIFYDLGVEELVGLVASIAGDPHRPYFRLRANPFKKEYFKQMSDVVERVRAAYRNPATSEVQVVPDAAVTALTWMEANSWPEFAALLRLSGVAEGDVARLISQTADHLNQLTRLHATHPALASTASEGRSRILRPPLSEAVVVD